MCRLEVESVEHNAGVRNKNIGVSVAQSGAENSIKNRNLHTRTSKKSRKSEFCTNTWNSPDLRQQKPNGVHRCVGNGVLLIRGPLGNAQPENLSASHEKTPPAHRILAASGAKSQDFAI